MRWPWKVLRIAAIAYIAGGLVLYAFQRRMQYRPNDETVRTPPGAEDVTLETADGLAIKATYWPANGDTTLLIFHGNAGHRGDRFSWARGFAKEGWGVLLLDYRGYGGSEGSPTEEGLRLDADAAADFLAERGAQRVVYLGRSLGAGVAIDLASRRAPAALIIESGALALVDVAAASYPIYPVRWMMKDPFDGREKVPMIRCPGLFLHGANDELVPPRLGRELFDAYPGKKEWIEVPGAGHNDVVAVWGDAYYDRIATWLQEAR